MFSPTARIASKAEQERLLRTRAIEEASALFGVHGVAAVGIVAAETMGPASLAEERRYGRLVVLEIERLDRARRSASSSAALRIWRPQLLSIAGIARLLGVRRKR